VLELVIPSYRASKPGSEQITVVRSFISDTPTGFVRNAFFSRTPAAAVQNKTCRASGSSRLRAFVPQAASLNAAATFKALGSYKVVYLATDYDPLFASAIDCSSDTDCNNKLVAIVHHAAVPYEEHLGMTLEVARQYGPTSSYTTSTDSGTLLDDFSQQNAADRSDVFDDGVNDDANLIDVFALFTGRDIDQNVIGLAYLGLGCLDADPSGAAMLVQHVSRTFDPVVTAHELGHIFSAEHTSSGIMKASLSSPLPSTFSSVSVQEISSHRDQYYNECRQGLSSGVGNNLDQTLSLRIRKTSGGKITITTTTSALQSGCSIVIRAGQSSSGASTGEIIKRFTPQSLSTSLTGTVSSRIKGSSATATKVFVRGFYSCTDGYTYARSGVVSFNANSRAGRGPAISRASWIRAFNKAF
jgi:hypothetical protein